MAPSHPTLPDFIIRRGRWHLNHIDVQPFLTPVIFNSKILAQRLPHGSHFIGCAICSVMALYCSCCRVCARTYVRTRLLVACDTVVFVYVLSVCVHNCVLVGLHLICQYVCTLVRITRSCSLLCKLRQCVSNGVTAGFLLQFQCSSHLPLLAS